MPRQLDERLRMGFVEMSLREWARLYSIKPVIVRQRLARGWNAADAVTSPPKGVPVRLVVRS